MDWSKERWVKHYKRRTVEWCMASFDARGVLNELIVLVDDAGHLPLGTAGVPGLAHVLNMSADRCQAAVDELVARSWIVITGDRLIVPAHYEQQSAVTSNALRQESHRERKRYQNDSTVTRSNAESRDVTQNNDKRERVERVERRDLVDPSPVTPLGLTPEVPSRSREARDVGTRVLAYLQSKAGRGMPLKLNASRLRRVSRLITDGWSYEDFTAVVWLRTQGPDGLRWLGDPKMDQYVRFETLFSPEKAEPNRELARHEYANFNPPRARTLGWVGQEDATNG